jgi:uncharacterized protein YecT (DUF1311 family)
MAVLAKVAIGQKRTFVLHQIKRSQRMKKILKKLPVLTRFSSIFFNAWVLVLVFISPIAFAEVECTDRPECWPEGSSMHTGLLLVQQQKAVEKLLASKHDELIKLVSSSSSVGIPVDGRLLAALKTQQAAWLKYRVEECELIGSLTGAGGTWPSTYANKCELNHSEQRLRRVRSAIRCIEKFPLEKRLFEQNNCLQQLAPLTNK